MSKVSIIIPARNEIYLQPTIDTLLEMAGGEIEVVPVIDGYKPEPALKIDDRVKPVYLDKSIGQRAGYNLGVRESTGEYLMKLDGHAMVGQDFDLILKESIRHCGTMTTIIPEMRRLDVKNWCPKPKGATHFMYFGTDLFCHYWRPYRRRPEAKEKYPEVMTGQGSCWFLHREWNDYIGLLDEKAGSWGKVGIEVSVKTWCQGGSQRVCKDTWQAHYFRVSDGGFPYPMDGRNIRKAKDYARETWYFNTDVFGEKQVRPFEWIIKKFAPVPGWEIYLEDKKVKRAIIYYTDHSVEESLAQAVRKNIENMVGDLVPIISVSQIPISFGENICVGKKERNYISLYEQILAGLEKTDADVIYLCEHDIFYHSSHFAFVPEQKNTIYYNQNAYYWKVGKNIYLPCPGNRKALSQAVSYKKNLIKHCKQRIIDLTKDKNSKINDSWATFESDKPNIDIRHDNNFSKDGTSKRNYYKDENSKAVENVAHWGSVRHMMKKAKYKGTLRTDIINYLIEQNDYQRYLEIGVKKNDNFNYIRCEHKDGVDPNGRCNYPMTSDEFFGQVNGHKYDIIFIDGLHEFKQVLKDVNNSLAILNEGGAIVMHDCCPEKEINQLVPPPENLNIWNGDVWKAFAILRTRPGLEAYVVDTNNGIGIVKKGKQKTLNIIEDELTWPYFQANRNELLNLISVEDFKKREKNARII